jgi:hypothetical protein
MGENNRAVKWQQQIDKFKKSELYLQYLLYYPEKREQIPEVRLGSGKWSPKNPIVDTITTSKRGFDGMMKDWKRKIHEIMEKHPIIIYIPEQYDCNVCGNPADLYCSGCYSAVYCSVECQTQAWRLHQFSCINKSQ